MCFYVSVGAVPDSSRVTVEPSLLETQSTIHTQFSFSAAIFTFRACAVILCAARGRGCFHGDSVGGLYLETAVCGMSSMVDGEERAAKDLGAILARVRASFALFIDIRDYITT